MERKVIKIEVHNWEMSGIDTTISTGTQPILHFLKSKGLITTGNTVLKPVGTVKVWYDPKEIVTHYEQVIEEDG